MLGGNGRGWDDAGTQKDMNSGSATSILVAAAIAGIGNGSAEGYCGEITLLNQTSAAFWTRVFFQGYFIDSQATPSGVWMAGGGAKETAQDTDAVQFLFSSGNISAGNYACYGLA